MLYPPFFRIWQAKVRHISQVRKVRIDTSKSYRIARRICCRSQIGPIRSDNAMAEPHSQGGLAQHTGRYRSRLLVLCGRVHRQGQPGGLQSLNI